MLGLFSVAVLALASVAAVQDSNPHKIDSLPGYNDPKPINFDQYAGHIELPSNGQKMFYWLVESESNPDTDPLVLWLNGGPGCSSLGGFFTELGPFVVESDLSVKRNPYAWNRKANVLFLESPAGVGFSQPRLNDTDYNDEFTMDRVYEFLVQFYGVYGNYNNREFYVTGESYAGIYVPYLAYKLVQKPIAKVNFTGFAIGNPYTDQIVDGNAYMDYYYSHGLISIESYNEIQAKCPSQVLFRCQQGVENCTDACRTALSEATFSADTSSLNPYYLYGDVCLLKNTQATKLPYYNIRPNTHRGVIGPCQEQYTEQYLRQDEVQQAIHVTGGHVDWSDCADLAYHGSASSLQKYPTILSAGLKALIYSGDADSVVNFLGTQRWITKNGLNLQVKQKWQAWFGPDKQLAGYTEVYTNLTFTTIKGAGHMVPATRPLHGLYMFECFLYGQATCSNFSYPKDPLEYLSGADLSAPTGSNTTSTDYFWWVVGAIVLVLVIFGGWRYFASQQARQDAIKYTELTADAKPSYS
ncbi:hypothetical protein LEN26_009137 [Aphanomyces euteiches]|nr:hypothetical protein AeMF1_016322 [Aphanomyces euteiches]KAH9128259.1 hypothetical protein LEN26_009137 [Aphanomyces euteiches]KAH9131370.1 hypothetical protein AeNC1_019679 [Aphanomyces euteiches]